MGLQIRLGWLIRKFDPNQPRAPKGDPEGGQWTGTGTSTRQAVIPEEQFQALRDDIARQGQLTGEIPPEIVKSIEDSFQEFARDAQVRMGPLQWAVMGSTQGQFGYNFSLIGKHDSGAVARFILEAQPKWNKTGDYQNGKPLWYNLYVDYAAMPGQFQQKGMGSEIVKNVMHTARVGGFKSVIYEAVSTEGGTLSGAYVWAKMGAQFSEEHERKRVVEGYAKYHTMNAPNPTPDEIYQENLKKMATWEPQDILKAPLGKEYLLTDVRYHGKFDVR